MTNRSTARDAEKAGHRARGSGGEGPYERLLALFDDHQLTPAQRRVAQYVLENAHEAVFLSSNELGKRAHVSQPSITRFAQALGFPGYAGLIGALREALRWREVASPLSHADHFGDAIALEIANLEALRDVHRDFGQLREASRLLMSSQPLVVMGFRASSNLAGYFAYFARKVHPDVRLIQDGGSYVSDLLEQTRFAGATTLIAFVLPRYPREVFDALSLAKSLGYEMIAVSDCELGRLEEYCRCVLVARVGSSLIFDSHAAPTHLTAMILDAMCEVEPEASQAKLEVFDRSAIARHLFVD